ncbi:hypothetical protein LCGC14_0478840 [marine sediment metagenome]|uniref:Uncharacterized protein n=1 Tax=marine sediment metagenome TaxID=412755 RepID=A0A0F9SA16_9ZZZZ
MNRRIFIGLGIAVAAGSVLEIKELTDFEMFKMAHNDFLSSVPKKTYYRKFKELLNEEFEDSGFRRGFSLEFGINGCDSQKAFYPRSTLNKMRKDNPGFDFYKDVFASSEHVYNVALERATKTESVWAYKQYNGFKYKVIGRQFPGAGYGNLAVRVIQNNDQKGRGLAVGTEVGITPRMLNNLFVEV